MRALAVALLLAAGCSDSGGAQQDLSAVVDLGPPNADLFGVDFAGDYNCVQLNLCESDPKCQNQLCQTACRNNATPSAQTKDQALQQCFSQYCPQQSDLGMAICARDSNGMITDACKTCLANTQRSMTGACTPANAPECHACLQQATDCKNDHF
jgi:hypothetical protein